MRQDDDANNLVQDLLPDEYQCLNWEQANVFSLPLHDSCRLEPLYEPVNGILQLLHFHQPSTAGIALVGAFRRNVNLCEGSFYGVRDFAGYLKPIMFFGHCNRDRMVFYRHSNAGRIGRMGCKK